MSENPHVVAGSVPFPWSNCDDAVTEGYGRRTIVVPGDIDEITANVCEDPLPEVGRWQANNCLWKRFELPAADWQGGGIPTVAELRLISRRRTVQKQNVILAAALPRPSVDITTDVEGDSLAAVEGILQVDAARLGIALTCEEITDNHVEYVNDLYDHQWPHSHYWEENVDGVALRSVKRSVARWRRSGAQDEARLALIVKLAAKLPPIVQDVCERPRVVLRRVREMLGVSRVQEVDASCLRWLARQPGRSIVEKAGTRQQVLGITRVEDADTPENRVVRDLLVRATAECRRYLSENQQFSNHSRVLLVRGFRTLLHRMQLESPVGRVSPLVGEAQANYVLQHEPRYRQLWEAYLLLVHQQKQQDNIWRWRERTWGEVCGLVLWNAMFKLACGSPALRSSVCGGSALRSDVFCRDEQFAGTFFDGRTAVASWELKRPFPSSRVDIVTGQMLAQHSAIPRALRPLCPDFVVNRYGDSHPYPLIAIWTLLQAPVGTDSFDVAMKELSNRLAHINSSTAVQGLILTPAYQDTSSFSDPPDCLEIVRLKMPFAADDFILEALTQKWGIS